MFHLCLSINSISLACSLVSAKSTVHSFSKDKNIFARQKTDTTHRQNIQKLRVYLYGIQ